MAHYLRSSDSRLLCTSDSVGMTKSASFWRAGSAVTCPASTRRTELPTDRDYQRILNRLEHLISGSVVSLTEEKHLELNLDEDDWQFVRVRTQARPSPMTVLLSPHQGQVTVYLSLSSQEPRPDYYDQCFTRDVVTYSEVGGKLKSPWVFLGIHCGQETALKLSLRFGKHDRRQHSEAHLTSLPDLNEYRRDESKRQALALKVEQLLVQRHTAWTLKYAGKDYIKDNCRVVLRVSDADKREIQTERRQAAVLRRKQRLRDKKAKALLTFHRQELRAEEQRQAQLVLTARQTLQSQQKHWLLWMSTTAALDTLWDKLQKRKSTFEVATRRMKAAMVLQRCYKKVLLTVNPKRSNRLRALHHMNLYFNLGGYLDKAQIRTSLKTVICASAEVHLIRKSMSKFHRQVILIQQMWRKYAVTQHQRMQLLHSLWETAVTDLLDTAKQTGKRKLLLDLKARLTRVDSHAVLQEHMLRCKQQFYKDISAYINSNPAVRKGLKSLMREETTGAPAFQYLPSNMQTVVQGAVYA